MEKKALIRKEYGRTQKWALYGMLSFSFLWTGYALFWFYEKLYRAQVLKLLRWC